MQSDREGTATTARTLHFLWPPEIEGTTILSSAADLAERIVAAVHWNGRWQPRQEAVFRVSVTATPTFVNDVARPLPST